MDKTPGIIALHVQCECTTEVTQGQAQQIRMMFNKCAADTVAAVAAADGM